MDEDTELRNPFPSPPSHYTKYTTHNLNLLALLREREPEKPNPNQYDVLKDQQDVPDWPLVQLEKPRVDWILEEPDAYYEVFGDRWFVKEKIPSLAELGGNQLYPADPSIDRRPALLSVLRSLLVTYSSLTGSLLSPPPTVLNAPPEWQRHVEWITVLSQNLMDGPSWIPLLELGKNHNELAAAMVGGVDLVFVESDFDVKVNFCIMWPGYNGDHVDNRSISLTFDREITTRAMLAKIIGFHIELFMERAAENFSTISKYNIGEGPQLIWKDQVLLGGIKNTDGNTWQADIYVKNLVID